MSTSAPVLFIALAKHSSHWIDTDRALKPLDRRFDIDGYVLPYSRSLGALPCSPAPSCPSKQLLCRLIRCVDRLLFRYGRWFAVPPTTGAIRFLPRLMARFYALVSWRMTWPNVSLSTGLSK
ncbi:MAG: hypothetical protein HY000_06030 [Planctomycetes bacterium]|nr:hypothetical protein [Planctomycetota bacterium]